MRQFLDNYPQRLIALVLLISHSLLSCRNPYTGPIKRKPTQTQVSELHKSTPIPPATHSLAASSSLPSPSPADSYSPALPNPTPGPTPNPDTPHSLTGTSPQPSPAAANDSPVPSIIPSIDPTTSPNIPSNPVLDQPKPGSGATQAYQQSTQADNSPCTHQFPESTHEQTDWKQPITPIDPGPTSTPTYPPIIRPYKTQQIFTQQADTTKPSTTKVYKPYTPQPSPRHQKALQAQQREAQGRREHRVQIKPTTPQPNPILQGATHTRTLTAPGGHQVSLIQQQDQGWRAHIEENVLAGFSRRLILPVHVTAGTHRTARLRPNQIQITFPEKDPIGRGYVYLGPLGLSGGGGTQGRDVKYVACNTCGRQAPVVEVRDRGSFFWIDFSTYYYRCAYCQSQAAAQANREYAQRQAEAAQAAAAARIQAEQGRRLAVQRQREAAYQNHQANLAIQLKTNQRQIQAIENLIQVDLSEELRRSIEADKRHEADLAILASIVRRLEEDQSPTQVIDEVRQKINKYESELRIRHTQERATCQAKLAGEAIGLRDTAHQRTAGLQRRLEALMTQRRDGYKQAAERQSAQDEARGDWARENARKSAQEIAELEHLRQAAATARQAAQAGSRAVEREKANTGSQEGFWSKLGRGIKEIARTTWNKVKTTVSKTWSDIKTTASKTWIFLKTGTHTSWEGIKTIAQTSWRGIKTIASTSWEGIKTAAGVTWEGIKTAAGVSWFLSKQVVNWLWENKGSILKYTLMLGVCILVGWYIGPLIFPASLGGKSLTILGRGTALGAGSLIATLRANQEQITNFINGRGWRKNAKISQGQPEAPQNRTKTPPRQQTPEKPTEKEEKAAQPTPTTPQKTAPKPQIPTTQTKPTPKKQRQQPRRPQAKTRQHQPKQGTQRPRTTQQQATTQKRTPAPATKGQQTRRSQAPTTKTAQTEPVPTAPANKQPQELSPAAQSTAQPANQALPQGTTQPTTAPSSPTPDTWRTKTRNGLKKALKNLIEHLKENQTRPEQQQQQQTVATIQQHQQQAKDLLQQYQLTGPTPALVQQVQELADNLNQLTQQQTQTHQHLNYLAQDPTNSLPTQHYLAQYLQEIIDNLANLQQAQENLEPLTELIPEEPIDAALETKTYQELTQELTSPTNAIEIATNAQEAVQKLLEQYCNQATNPSSLHDQAEQLQQDLAELLQHLKTRQQALEDLYYGPDTSDYINQNIQTGSQQILALNHSIKAIQTSLKVLSTTFHLPIPNHTTPAPPITPEMLKTAFNTVLDLTVPGSELIKILLGTQERPQDLEDWLQLAAETALDLIPGGKVFKAFKGLTKQIGIKNIEKQLLKEAKRMAKEMGKKVAKGVGKLYSEATFKALEKQLAKDGMKSILKTQTKIQKNLAEHIQKLVELKEAGGYYSSVEREIKTFQAQLEAIKDLLK